MSRRSGRRVRSAGSAPLPLIDPILALVLTAGLIGALAWWLHQNAADTLRRRAEATTIYIDLPSESPNGVDAEDPGATAEDPPGAEDPPADSPPAAPLAVLVTDLGLRVEESRAAIERLPASVSLAFLPTRNTIAEGQLADLAAAAVADGHVVLVQVPMEAADPVLDNAGDQALMVDLAEAENLKRLEEFLALVPSAAGIVTRFGSRFTAEEAPMRAVMTALAERGLIFVDATGSAVSLAGQLGAELEVPVLIARRRLDEIQDPETIAAELADAAASAGSEGALIATLRARDRALTQLEAWIGAQDPRKVSLVPVTELARPTPGG